MESNPDVRETPDVSVIIVTWNSEAFISRCIESLESARGAIHFDVTVVDNASSDGTIELLKTGFPWVRVIKQSENCGYGGAINIGAANSYGEFILVLNPDTVILPSMLDLLVEVLERDDTIGCVGPRQFSPSFTPQWSTDDFPSLLGECVRFAGVDRLRLLRPYVERHYGRWSSHTDERDVDWVGGACMLLRRDVFDRVGGFDESFFMFSEEIDLCLRIWQSGHRVHFLPSAEIVHFNGGSFQSSDWRREVLRYQGSLRYFRKHKSRADYHLFQLFMRFDAFLHLALLAFKFLPRRTMQTDGRRRLSLRTQDASTLLDVKTRWATLTLRTDASIRPQRLPSR